MKYLETLTTTQMDIINQLAQKFNEANESCTKIGGILNVRQIIDNNTAKNKDEMEKQAIKRAMYSAIDNQIKIDGDRLTADLEVLGFQCVITQKIPFFKLEIKPKGVIHDTDNTLYIYYQLKYNQNGCRVIGYQLEFKNEKFNNIHEVCNAPAFMTRLQWIYDRFNRV